MRILIFHGYLLRGTGSNIYNASLCRALARLGHEVHLLCQERRTEGLDLPEGVHVHVPDIGRTLPVYVADSYDGFDAVPYPGARPTPRSSTTWPPTSPRCRTWSERVAPDVALANHLVMGPVILARGLGGRVPYAVKVHGSALEYTVRPHPRALPAVRARGRARGRPGCWSARGTPPRASGRCSPTSRSCRRARAWGRLGSTCTPSGPREPQEAAERLQGLAERLEGAAAASWGGEEGAAAALRALDPTPRPDRRATSAS